MEREEAKKLVVELMDVAFKAGQYSANSESLIYKSETKKAILLADKIISLIAKKG